MSAGAQRRGRAQRGVALLLVLWLITLLTGLAGAYALLARVEHLQGRTLQQSVSGGEAARAGLEYAVLRLLDTDDGTRWRVDGRPYTLELADASVEIRIIDESGKLDLNHVDPALFASLLRVLGTDPAQADGVAGAIADWRDGDDLTAPNGAERADYTTTGRPYGPKNAPFESIGELEQVLGMSPALYRRLAGHVTVFAGRAVPDARFASAEVLQAMGVDPVGLLAGRSSGPATSSGFEVAHGTGTYSIESRARMAGDRLSVLRAVVRLGDNAIPGAAYTPLRWNEGNWMVDG